MEENDIFLSVLRTVYDFFYNIQRFLSLLLGKREVILHYYFSYCSSSLHLSNSNPQPVFSMDCVRPILDVATRLWDCTTKRAVYIRHLPQNLNSLRTEMEELKNLYEDVKERVEREEKRQKKRLRVVDGWLRGVEAMEKQVQEILAKGDEEIQKKCLGNCCPKNCGASYKLGKMVIEKIDAVTVNKTEGSNFSVVAEPLPSPAVIERQLDKTVGQDLLFGKV